MKCRLLNAMRIMNPAWSEAAANEAKAKGEKYNIPFEIDVAAGFEISDPQAWIHCCPGDLNAPPIAEPADAECVEAVRVWMEEKRPAAIAAIKAQLDQIDKVTNPEDKKRLLAMGKAYGLLGDKKQAAPAAPAPEAPKS